MKNLFLFLSLCFVSSLAHGQGDSPPFLKGQGQASKALAVIIEVPNNLITKTSSSKALIENGNKNILANPSFEHVTFDTSWVASGTSIKSAETSVVIDGLKSFKKVTTAQTINLSQSSTLYQAQFADGVQCLAMVRVKTSHTGLIQVCSIQAGTVSTTDCVNVSADSKWGLYKVPFICGGTSNGISIVGATGTGVTYIDDSYVGAQDIKQDISQCFDTACTDTFSANISTTPTATKENIAWVTSVAKSGTNNGIKNLAIPAGIFSVIPNCNCTAVATATSADISCKFNPAGSTMTSLVFNTANNAVAEDREIVVSCQKQGADWTSAQRAKVGNVYSSTNANTDWASCGHVPADFTGFGTASAIETQCRRDGGDLLMKGKFTVGISTAVEARLALRFNGATLTSKGVSVIPSIQLSGAASTDVFSSTYFGNMTLIEPSVTYITFGHQNSTRASITKANGSTVASTGSVLSFSARVPITGWDNSNVIIGTFNEVMTVPGVTKPVNFRFNLAASSTQTAICTTGACTLNMNKGGIAQSSSFTSTGIYGVVLSGLASSEYVCSFATRNWTSGSTPTLCWYENKTSTGFDLRCAAGGTAMNAAVDVNCNGERP